MNDGEFPRQWKLTRLLSGCSLGLTAMDLAAELGVTDRTIKRDLAVLRAVEIPIVETVETRGTKRYCIEIDQTRMPRLNYEEVAALWLGRRFLDPFEVCITTEAAAADGYFHAVSCRGISGVFSPVALRTSGFRLLTLTLSVRNRLVCRKA